jgi:predicted dehydrogenase
MLSEWSAFPETGGGPLLYVGSHLVDAILWFLNDDPVEVYANVRYRTDTKADETSSFQVCFAKGAVAQGLVTQAGHAFFNIVNIYGREGRISLIGSGFLQYDILVTSNRVAAYAQPTILRPGVTYPLPLMKHVPQLEDFVQAIQEKRQPAITASDGRRVLKILDAVVESGRLGRAVELS